MMILVVTEVKIRYQCVVKILLKVAYCTYNEGWAVYRKYRLSTVSTHTGMVNMQYRNTFILLIKFLWLRGGQEAIM